MVSSINSSSEEIEDNYIDLLVRMNIFLEKLIDFCNKTSKYLLKIDNPVPNELLIEYVKLMDNFNLKESRSVPDKFNKKMSQLKYDYKDKDNLDLANSDRHLIKKKNGICETDNTNINKYFSGDVAPEISIEKDGLKKTCCGISNCNIF